MPDKYIQILDLSVTITSFILACVIGKIVMDEYHTWLSFNGPAIGMLVIGAFGWGRLRKSLMKRE